MLRFERECRTPYSEVYTIYDDDQPQGRFDVSLLRHHHPRHAVRVGAVHDGRDHDLIEDLDDDVLDAIGLVRDDFVVHSTRGGR